MSGMTRRRFLQAMSLSVPAAIALKVLPVLDAVAATAPIAAEESARTLPREWTGLVLWINDEPYAVRDISGESPSDSINVSSFDDHCSLFVPVRRKISVKANLVGRHSLLSESPSLIRVELGTHCVEFKSYIRHCEWRECLCPDCRDRATDIHRSTLVELNVLHDVDGAVTWREL